EVMNESNIHRAFSLTLPTRSMRAGDIVAERCVSAKKSQGTSEFRARIRYVQAGSRLSRNERVAAKFPQWVWGSEETRFGVCLVPGTDTDAPAVIFETTCPAAASPNAPVTKAAVPSMRARRSQVCCPLSPCGQTHKNPALSASTAAGGRIGSSENTASTP